MDVIINDFIALLRRHGIRVSPAECIDALQALHVAGLYERAIVHDTLRATLIKSKEDIAIFDWLFDLYFALHPTATQAVSPHLRNVDADHDHGVELTRVEWGEELEGEAEESEDHSHGDTGPTEMRRFFSEEQLRPTQNIHGEEPDRLRLSLFAQELVLNQKQGSLQNILQQISHYLHVRRARNIFSPGGIAPLTGGEELPIDIAATELQALVDHLHDLAVDEALIEQLTAMTDTILQGLPALLQSLLERQRKLQHWVDDRQLQQQSLRRLLNFSSGEQQALEAAIRRVARQIHGSTTRRLRQDRVGKISIAHTLRHNQRYDGIPFQPVLRRKREQRPRLVLLCDVSLSTRNLARFWLHMVYQMQALFSRVRTFVFVADMVEVTQLFAEQPLRQAIESIFGGHVLDVDTNSDFGRAIEQFRNNFLSAANRRTTVVILGDGRNNGRPPNVEALEEVAHHARRILWMTPEPRWGWTLGSCDMSLYEPHCQRIEVVRTVEQLAQMAESLVRHKLTC